MMAPKMSAPARRLEDRYVEIEVHAVDAFHLEGDVIAHHVGDGAW